MSTFVAIILALTLKGDLRDHYQLYQVGGHLGVQQQITATFTPRASSPYPIKVEVKGDGHGDIDCYVLHHNTKGDGWVVGAKDESNMDRCSMVYLSNDDQLLRLWVVNHGVHPTTFTATVDQ
jgi:hypothetical protein